MNENWLRDARQITTKVVFEPFVNNKSKILYATSPTNDYNNIYSQIAEKYNNQIPTILVYNPTKKLGYFDGVDTSFIMSKNRLATKFNAGLYKGDFNAEYSSNSITDSMGYVVNPETGDKSSVEIDFYMDTSLDNTSRYLEVVGDIQHGEYPRDFEVHIDNGDVFTVNDNTNVHAIIDFNDYIKMGNKFKLIVTRWSKPYSSVKLNYVSTDIVFEASNRDMLIEYSIDNVCKNNGDLDYGLKYNSANIKLYSDDKSYGKVKYNNTSSSYSKKYFNNVLNTTDILCNIQTNVKCKFYIKTQLDPYYTYIGKYFTIKTEYNTQSDIVNIECYDILQRLQSIDASGLGTVFSGLTLYETIKRLSDSLKNKHNIIVDYSNCEDELSLIYIPFPAYEAQNLWGLFEGCCTAGQFYIVANNYNEDYDIDIILER